MTEHSAPGPGEVAVITYQGEPARPDGSRDTYAVDRVGLFRRGDQKVVEDAEFAEFAVGFYNGSRERRGVPVLFTLAYVSPEEALAIKQQNADREHAEDELDQLHARLRAQGGPARHRQRARTSPNSQVAEPTVAHQTAQQQEGR